MRRLIIPFVLLVGVLTLAASGLADPGDKGKGKAQGKNKFSFQLTTTDNRCNGIGTWATLTETRTLEAPVAQPCVSHVGTRYESVSSRTFTNPAGWMYGEIPFLSIVFLAFDAAVSASVKFAS